MKQTLLLVSVDLLSLILREKDLIFYFILFLLYDSGGVFHKRILRFINKLKAVGIYSYKRTALLLLYIEFVIKKKIDFLKIVA